MLVIRKMEAGEKRANICSSLGLAQAAVTTVMANAVKNNTIGTENYKIASIKCKLHQKFNTEKMEQLLTLWVSFNRTQSTVVTGLFTGHNTLRRHVYLLGLLDSPLCRKCGVKEETSAHILCECEALASLGHVYLGSFFGTGGRYEYKPGGRLDL